MKKNFIFLVFIFLISCGTLPSTGISSNPNFIKGKIFYSDNKPINRALVVAINNADSLKAHTDGNGLFEISADEDKQYKLDVVLSGHVIFSVDDISTNEGSNPFMFKTEYDSVYYADSVINKEPSVDIPDIDTSTIDTSIIDTSSVDTSAVEEDSVIIALDRSNSMLSYIGFDSEKNDDNKVSSDEGIIVLGNKEGVYNRVLLRMSNIRNEYDSVFISFKLDEEIFNSSKKMKIYRLLRDWEDNCISAIYSKCDEKWSEIGVGFNNYDATIKPSYEGDFSDMSNDGMLRINLTSVFDEWTKGAENNYGLIITLGENDEYDDKNYCMFKGLDSSDEKPFVTYYK